MIEIEVPEEHDVARGGLGADLKAGMGERIHHNVIVRANEALDDPEAGGPASRVENGFLRLQEGGQAPLELDRRRCIAD